MGLLMLIIQNKITAHPNLSICVGVLLCENEPKLKTCGSVKDRREKTERVLHGIDPQTVLVYVFIIPKKDLQGLDGKCGSDGHKFSPFSSVRNRYESTPPILQVIKTILESRTL